MDLGDEIDDQRSNRESPHTVSPRGIQPDVTSTASSSHHSVHPSSHLSSSSASHISPLVPPPQPPSFGTPSLSSSPPTAPHSLVSLSFTKKNPHSSPPQARDVTRKRSNSKNSPRAATVHHSSRLSLGISDRIVIMLSRLDEMRGKTQRMIGCTENATIMYSYMALLNRIEETRVTLVRMQDRAGECDRDGKNETECDLNAVSGCSESLKEIEESVRDIYGKLNALLASDEQVMSHSNKHCEFSLRNRKCERERKCETVKVEYLEKNMNPTELWAENEQKFHCLFLLSLSPIHTHKHKSTHTPDRMNRIHRYHLCRRMIHAMCCA